MISFTLSLFAWPCMAPQIFCKKNLPIYHTSFHKLAPIIVYIHTTTQPTYILIPTEPISLPILHALHIFHKHIRTFHFTIFTFIPLFNQFPSLLSPLALPFMQSTYILIGEHVHRLQAGKTESTIENGFQKGYKKNMV